MSSSTTARKNISIWTAVLFVITGLSGIILLAAHPGHGAGASSASIIVKHVHEFAAIPFTLIALVHVCLNWRVFARYFRG